MRALLALLLLAGCDRVFGLGDPYEDARAAGSADALAVDGTQPTRDTGADGDTRIPQPLVHYRFDSSLQEAGGVQKATCTTSASTPCLYSMGVYGEALHFDGSSIATFPLPSLPPTFTLMVWVHTGPGPVIDLPQSVGVPSRDTWELDLAGNGITFSSYGSSGTQITGGARPAETWTHIAVTYSGTQQRVFVDQAPQAVTQVSTIAYGADQTVCVGCRTSQTTTEYFVGDIDDVYVFDSVLTQAEITAYATSAH